MKLALSLAFSISLQAQNLTIGGDVVKSLTLNKDDLAKMPRTTVTLNDHGKATSYVGVLLYDILKRVGAPIDSQLTGKALASYLLAEARDGYQVVYALAELDPAFTDNKVIIADSVDGKPLPETQGPFRLVIPQDKKPARSIRMLEKITVVRLRK